MAVLEPHVLLWHPCCRSRLLETSSLKQPPNSPALRPARQLLSPTPLVMNHTASSCLMVPALKNPPVLLKSQSRVQATSAFLWSPGRRLRAYLFRLSLVLAAVNTTTWPQLGKPPVPSLRRLSLSLLASPTLQPLLTRLNDTAVLPLLLMETPQLQALLQRSSPRGDLPPPCTT